MPPRPAIPALCLEITLCRFKLFQRLPMLLRAAARRDKQEAEGRAAQAASDLQQEQQCSAAELRRLQAAAEEEHTEAKVSSDERMEEYTSNFRSAHECDKTIGYYLRCFIILTLYLHCFIILICWPL